MNNISDMLINILIIAFIASLAEELFFRGVLQQMLIKWSNQAHLSILITAALFSAVHMQFHGFPRRISFLRSKSSIFLRKYNSLKRMDNPRLRSNCKKSLFPTGQANLAVARLF